jgi:ribosomal protein S18 acetylase RimI-like enzyme
MERQPSLFRAMQIRPFRDSDEAAVIALWEAAGLTRPWNDPRKDIERKRSVRREWFLVGTVEDAVMGSIMIGYDGHRGWINYLAVDAAHRGRGHARTLMREAERVLKAAGCPKVNLQIRRSNAQVIAFYEAIGYAQDDVVSFGRRLIDDESNPP